MPSTCQEITLQGQLGAVVSNCAGNLKMARRKKKRRAKSGSGVMSGTVVNALVLWQELELS